MIALLAADAAKKDSLLDTLGIVLPEVFIQIVGFLLLVWVLRKVAWGPILGLIDQRAEEIRGGVRRRVCRFESRERRLDRRLDRWFDRRFDRRLDRWLDRWLDRFKRKGNRFGRQGRWLRRNLPGDRIT